MVRLLVIFYTLVLSVTNATAQEKYNHEGQWGLGVGAGLAATSGPHAYKDGFLSLDGEHALGAWVRYHYTQRFAVEMAYSNLNFDYKQVVLSELNPYFHALDLSAAYRMWPTQALHVLIQGGVGVAHINDMKGIADTDAELVLKVRMGIEYMLDPNWMWALYGDFHRLDVGNDLSEGLRLLSPSFGVTYYFGNKTESVDSDGDGVPNSVDKCAATPMGSKVDAGGCPLAHAVDADADGVADSDDRCPGTPAGQTVNAYGCASTEKAEFTLNIKFQTGSSKLDPQFVDDLEKFAEFLKKYPESKVEIEGHTDNTGNEAANFRISESRAKSVVNFMSSKYGIAKNRMNAKGYGPSQPVADNSTAEGRDKNRRVVAHVISP